MENPTQPRENRPIVGGLRFFLWILLLLAFTEFVMRGPVRFVREPGTWNDLSQNYTAARLWLKGQSPSDPNNFTVLWLKEGGSRLPISDPRTHLAPPLGSLVIMAPIAALPWPTAKILWLIVLMVAFGLTVWALVLAGGLKHDELRTLAFVAACFALAPFQTGIANGNSTILMLGACAVAIWAAEKRRDVTAGILFGIACSLKPQTAAFLVLYYLVKRRWRVFATAVACTLGLVLVAVLYMQLRDVSWMHDYLSNAKGFVTANQVDDFSSANPIRFTLINLQVPFFVIIGHSASANVLAFAVCALLLCVWLCWAIQRRQPRPELLCLGAVSVMALLPVYHRFYDAALLAVPLCWVMTALVAKSRSLAQVALLLMAPFLVPGAALLQQHASSGRIPEAVRQTWWWNAVVMPHETWALLLLCLILLHAMRGEFGRTNPETQNGANLSVGH